MTEEEFWHSTLRQLMALWKIHAKVNGFEEKEPERLDPREMLKWRQG